MSTSFPVSLIGFYVCKEKILHSGKKIWVLHSWSNGKNNFFFCHRNKIHTFKLMCNAPFIIKTYWWQCFWQIFQRFPKILQNFSKVTRVLPNIFYNFQRLQKIVFSSKTLVCNNRCLFSYYYQGNMQSRCFCSVRIWDNAVSCYSRDSYKWCNR